MLSNTKSPFKAQNPTKEIWFQLNMRGPKSLGCKGSKVVFRLSVQIEVAEAIDRKGQREQSHGMIELTFVE